MFQTISIKTNSDRNKLTTSTVQNVLPKESETMSLRRKEKDMKCFSCFSFFFFQQKETVIVWRLNDDQNDNLS